MKLITPQYLSISSVVGSQPARIPHPMLRPSDHSYPVEHKSGHRKSKFGYCGKTIISVITIAFFQQIACLPSCVHEIRPSLKCFTSSKCLTYADESKLLITLCKAVCRASWRKSAPCDAYITTTPQKFPEIISFKLHSNHELLHNR